MKKGFATHLGGRLCFCLGGFASVGSDHRVVTVKLRLSLRMSKSPPSKKRYNWLLLTVDKDLQIHIRAKKRVQWVNEDSGATEQFAALVKAKDHAAESVLPPTPKGKRERHSNNPNMLALRKKINQLANLYSVDKSNVIRKRLQEEKRTGKAVQSARRGVCSQHYWGYRERIQS